MQTTTTAVSRTSLLCLLSSGLSAAALADTPDIVEVTQARAWTTTEANAKELINLTADDCEQHVGVGSFAEMPLESTCEVQVSVPNEEQDDLLTSAGAYAYAGAMGWEFSDEDGSGFAGWSALENGMTTGADTVTESYSAVYHSIDFVLLERAIVQIEVCAGMHEAAYGTVQFTDEDADEEIFQHIAEGEDAECLGWTMELPAGNYRMWTGAYAGMTNEADDVLWANMAAGIIARPLTDAERADVNRDGVVDGADLAKVLAYWGSDIELVDLNQDGTVDGADITILFAYWT